VLLLKLLALHFDANLILLAFLMETIGLFVLLARLCNPIITVFDPRLAIFQPIVETIIGTLAPHFLAVVVTLLDVIDAILAIVDAILHHCLTVVVALFDTLGAIQAAIDAVLHDRLTVVVTLFDTLDAILTNIDTILVIVDAILRALLTCFLTILARSLALFLRRLGVVLALIFLALVGLIHARVPNGTDARQGYADGS
jgi:phage-related protein